MTIAEYHGYVRLEKVYYIRSLMNAHANHCAHVTEFYGHIVEEGHDCRRARNE
jgi:NADH:ubiquinone oxidoreductase subunit E